MKKYFPVIVIVLLVNTTIACGLTAEGVKTPLPIPSQVEDEGETFIAAPGIGNITLQTENEGVGEKPLFKWEAVPGAARYQLIVYDETSKPYWAWEGSATQIYIGGLEAEPPADSSGPIIEVDYSWAVMAFDTTGKLIAVSTLSPISP